jgi:GMP synthase (glutamine-hydrolysing)
VLSCLACSLISSFRDTGVRSRQVELPTRQPKRVPVDDARAPARSRQCEHEMTRERVAFLQHSPLDSPGVLGTRAAELGFGVQPFRADSIGDPLFDPEDFAAIVVLGSIESVNNPQLEWAIRERALIITAIDCNVPILGICFGGQILAQALGGRVITSPKPELGWMSIQSDAPSFIAEGPWLLWHEESIVPPPEAVVMARTEVAVQAYSKKPHLGLQFHPEVTTALVASWLQDARQRGQVTDAQRTALWDGIDTLATASAVNAGRLFDEFLRRADLRN